MAARRAPFRIEPRDILPKEAAARLRLSEPDFLTVLPRLQQRGFPPPDPDTGNFDLKAIDVWMDDRSGLAISDRAHDAGAGFEQRMRAFRAETGRRR